MTRKAQLTIFILIGILLVISFFLIFYISNNRNENAEVERTAKLSLESDQIKVYIESCLKSVAENGVFFIASRGGYYNLPNDYFTSRPTTAFYIKINQDVSPSLKDVEKELSKYIMDQLDFCIDKHLFAGKTIEYDAMEVSAVVENSGIVSINLNMPTKIVSGSSTFNLNTFRSTVNDIKLAKSFNLAKNITQEIVKNPKYLPLTFIYNSAESNNFKATINTYNDSTFVLQMFDKEDQDGRYSYNFAVQVNLENEN